MKKPAFRRVFVGLVLLNRFDGALGGAGAAADASLCDFVLTAGIFNCLNGALSRAGTASDACIRDFKSSHM